MCSVIQDPECTLLLCIDLTRGWGAAHASKAWNGQVQAVHPGLFQNRPGLRIWQLSWYPGAISVPAPVHTLHTRFKRVCNQMLGV